MPGTGSFFHHRKADIRCIPILSPSIPIPAARSAIRKLGGTYERTVRYTIPGTDVTHSVVVIRKTAPTPPKYPRRWAKMQKEHL